MYNLNKGHYKIYLYNDFTLLEKLTSQYKNDLILSKVFKHGRNNNSRMPCPLYVRIHDGMYIGKNTTNDVTSFDTPDMIVIEGSSLLKSYIPDELFQM